MSIFLYNFFHNQTNDRTEGGLVNIPTDWKEWPEAWKKVIYKHYVLFPSIPLKESGGALFHTLLKKRRSARNFFSNTVSPETLASILQCGYGLQERGVHEKRTVPSGGGRYPLEIYLLLFKPVDAFVSGTYHYDIEHHALEPVNMTQLTKEEMLSLTPAYDWLTGATGVVVITSIFHRGIQKYGSRGYRYILLEAGHVGQNMLLAGTECGLQMIPIGGVDEALLEKHIGLSGSLERVIYTLYF